MLLGGVGIGGVLEPAQAQPVVMWKPTAARDAGRIMIMNSRETRPKKERIGVLIANDSTPFCGVTSCAFVDHYKLRIYANTEADHRSLRRFG